jgi:hypothetical protein
MAMVFDSIGGVTTVRIAGARDDVVLQVWRISAELGAESWARFMGPVKWGDEYVVHGEIHDQGKRL